MVTVPRWKDSELSGDEWRFSVRVEAYRKGILLATYGTHSIRGAGAMLPSKLFFWGGTAVPQGWDEESPRSVAFWDAFCANPGCAEPATIEYRLIHHYCDEGHAHDASWRNEHIRFCERHKHRGDASFADADQNYTVFALLMPDGTWRELPAEVALDG